MMAHQWQQAELNKHSNFKNSQFKSYEWTERSRSLILSFIEVIGSFLDQQCLNLDFESRL